MQVSILTAGTLGLRVGPALGELVLLLGRLCMWKQLLASFIYADLKIRSTGNIEGRRVFFNYPYPPPCSVLK